MKTLLQMYARPEKTLTNATNTTKTVGLLALSLGLMLAVGAASLHAAPVGGELDLTFDPGSSIGGGAPGATGVLSMAVQPDGKVVIGGGFTGVPGAALGRIARLNPDGSTDALFLNGLAGADGRVECVALQPGGKVLVGGVFTFMNGQPRGRIARLNADGSLDTTFVPVVAGAVIRSILVQPDGRILIAGDFASVNGVPRTDVARLFPTGSLDAALLDPAVSGEVLSMAVQSDGKVVIGGDFTSVNGVARNRIARLNPNGSLDPGFQNLLAGANLAVRAVAVQSDGKVLIGGDFTSVNGAAHNRIARLNPDGTLDTAFAYPSPLFFPVPPDVSGVVRSIVVQPDGRILIAGDFGLVNNTVRQRVARLDPGGTVDFTFQNGLTGANDAVFAIALGADGKVHIGGYFTQVNGIPRDRVARLYGGGLADTTPPVITLLGPTPVTVECHTSYTDAGATAMDDQAGDLTSEIVVVSTVNVNAVGTYTVTYNVSDPSGNPAAPVVRTVTVVDTVPPEIWLSTSYLTVPACTPYDELGASAYDTCAGAVPVTIGGDMVNTDVPGTYVVSYQATDSSGNSATASRTVEVYDPLPVFTTIPSNLTLTCGPDNAVAISEWLASAAAADFCGPATITHAIGWSGPCGTDSAFVTWTATGARGRTATTSAALTILPDGVLTGARFGAAGLQVTLPANIVQQAAVTVLNSGSCAIVVQRANIAAGFASPGLSVLAPLPIRICAGSSATLMVRIDTTDAFEGVYAATLTLHGPEGGALALPIEIVVSGRLVPDLAANYTDGSVSFRPETSLVFPAAGEAFTIVAAVKNVGTAPAGPFTVKFFEGPSLLGTTQVAGLAVGQITRAAWEMPTGLPVEGFYLIRVEVVPPEGGELQLANNSAAGLLQVGTPFEGNASIRVTSSFFPDCSGSSGTLSIHAEYVIVSGQGTVTFPVQGGRVDALFQGTPFIVAGAHTDVSGNYSTSLGLPAGGSYTLEATVTDFTVTGTGSLVVTVPEVPNCSQGGVLGATGSIPPSSPPRESVDLYLCSPDILFRTGDGSMPLTAPPQAGQGMQLCAVVNYFTSTGRELNSQPVHFTAHRQTVDSVEEYFIGTALANFAGGGSTTVCVPWTVPDEGTFVVTVSLAPTVTQYPGNDVATRALVTASPAPPVTTIHVTAEGGAECVLSWVSGRATYERPGAPVLPVVCGRITVRIYDEAGTLLTTFGAPRTTGVAGDFPFGTTTGLPAGTSRIVVEVTDGSLTGSGEFTLECRPANSPAPGAPPAQGDLYLFAEHIAFLAPDCLNSWNRNPLPGETISVAANIHYFDNYSGLSLSAVPVDVNLLIPIGDTLQSLNINRTTVDFLSGGGSSVICVPWTPTVVGPQIVQVVIDPNGSPAIPFDEYLGNNAATKLIFVGLQDVVLTVDPRERRIRPGQSAAYTLVGESLDSTHPTLNLATYFEGPGTMPDSVTTSLGAGSLTLPESTSLTVATTAATPPGSYRFYVVGSGDQRSAVARFTLIVEAQATPPLQIACPADIVTLTDPGQCSAVVSFAVSAEGGCSVPTVVCAPLSGSTFPRGTTIVSCTATDDCGGTATCEFRVIVSNPPPTVAITGPASGTILPVGASVTFTGTYSDNPGDTHTGGFTADTLPLPTTLSDGTATATYSFVSPGVYAITLTVTDACGQSASDTSIGDDVAMVVVYDPSAGFVTGGDWIWSPPGAFHPGLAEFADAEGRANFGFVSKYLRGATVPAGETEFQFKTGALNFHSTSYQWLVVSGARAQFKGEGTINGAGHYGFLLTAIDGQISGGGGVDRFRIKIWDIGTDLILYDNQPGADDDAGLNDGTMLRGGSIVIHR